MRAARLCFLEYVSLYLVVVSHIVFVFVWILLQVSLSLRC